MEQVELNFEAVPEKPKHRKRPPHVLQAILEGDTATLRALGSKGGRVAGAKRHAEAEARKEMAALVRGSLKAPRKARTQVKSKAKKFDASKVDMSYIDELIAKDWHRLTLKDARAHAVRNLAGTRKD